jgi:tetratricopeptide (TPR) repeat protein
MRMYQYSFSNIRCIVLLALYLLFTGSNLQAQGMVFITKLIRESTKLEQRQSEKVKGKITVSNQTKKIRVSNSVRTSLNKANEYYQTENYDLAVLQYTKVLKYKPDDYNILNLRGLANLNAGNLKEALSDFNQALAGNDRLAEIWGNRGDVFAEMEQYDRAIADYTKGLKLDPTSAQLHVKRGLAWLEDRAENIENLTKAQNDFNKALRLDPGNFSARYGRGLAYLQRAIASADDGSSSCNKKPLNPQLDFADDSANKAIEEFTYLMNSKSANEEQQVIAKVMKDMSILISAMYNVIHTNESSNAIPYDNNLIVINNLLDDIEKYDEAVRQMLSTKSSNDLMLTKKQDDTKSVFDQVGIINGLKGAAHLARAFIYTYKEDYDAYFRDINTSISLIPSDGYLFFARGLGRVDTGDYDRAQIDLDEAINLDPKGDGYYYYRGKVHNIKKNFEKAIDDFSKELSLFPCKTEALFERGEAYSQLKLYNKAINDFTEAITLSNSNTDKARAYYLIGLTRNRMDMTPDQSNKDFTKSIELDKSFADAWYKRGLSYDEMKDYQKAVSDYNQVVMLKPDDLDVLLMRGISLNNLGRHSEAADDIERYLEWKQNDDDNAKVELDAIRKVTTKPHLQDRLDGVWKLAWGEIGGRKGDQIATIEIKNGRGLFTATSNELVSQQMSVSYYSDKIVLQGRSPVLLDSNNYPVIAAPQSYKPDTITIYKQNDGTYKLFLSDGVHIIKPVEIKVNKFKPMSVSGGLINAEWDLLFQGNNGYLWLNGNTAVYNQYSVFDIEQQLTSSRSGQNVLLRGSDVKIKGTNIKANGYSPDQILFKLSTYTSVSIVTKDDVNSKEYQEVPIKESPLRQIPIR